MVDAAAVWSRLRFLIEMNAFFLLAAWRVKVESKVSDWFYGKAKTRHGLRYVPLIGQCLYGRRGLGDKRKFIVSRFGVVGGKRAKSVTAGICYRVCDEDIFDFICVKIQGWDVRGVAMRVKSLLL